MFLPSDCGGPTLAQNGRVAIFQICQTYRSDDESRTLLVTFVLLLGGSATLEHNGRVAMYHLKRTDYCNGQASTDHN
jgi:hypothetical protein